MRADPDAEQRMKEEVDKVLRTGDSVGGVFEVVAHNVPPGLGSYVQWDERLDALFALRDLHRRSGHLQEVIVQNFRAKPGTRMAGAAAPTTTGIRMRRVTASSGPNSSAPPMRWSSL